MALRPFNLREYIAEEGKIKTIEDAVLGVISYGVITVAESMELDKITVPDEKAIQTVLLTLKKGDPLITREQILGLGETALFRLSELIGAAEDFRVKGSPPASNTTGTPKS
jgi:hypothetical protein